MADDPACIDAEQDDGPELPRRRCRALHFVAGSLVFVTSGAAGRYATATRPGNWCTPARSATIQARRGEADDDVCLRALEALTIGEHTP